VYIRREVIISLRPKQGITRKNYHLSGRKGATHPRLTHAPPAKLHPRPLPPPRPSLSPRPRPRPPSPHHHHRHRWQQQQQRRNQGNQPRIY
jgi:hypothetical protein